MRHVAAEGFSVRLRAVSLDVTDDVAVQIAPPRETTQGDAGRHRDFFRAIGGDDVALLDDAALRLERKIGALLALLSAARGDDVFGVPEAHRQEAVFSFMTAGDHPFEFQRDCRRAHARADEHRAPRVDIRAEVVCLQQRVLNGAVQPGHAARWRRGDDLPADRLPVRSLDLPRIVLEPVARRNCLGARDTSRVAVFKSRLMLAASRRPVRVEPSRARCSPK